jgi:hypothetical protein
MGPAASTACYLLLVVACCYLLTSALVEYERVSVQQLFGTFGHFIW